MSLGPCLGAHRACPSRAPATVPGSRPMCESCAAERRAARNRRSRKKDGARKARKAEARVAAVEELVRRGPGRPPLPPGEALDVALHLRISQAQAAKLDRMDEDRSKAVRRLIDEA